MTDLLRALGLSLLAWALLIVLFVHTGFAGLALLALAVTLVLSCRHPEPHPRHLTFGDDNTYRPTDGELAASYPYDWQRERSLRDEIAAQAALRPRTGLVTVRRAA